MNSSAAPIPIDNATVITATADLPPFQSTTQFPRNPKAEQLASLYANCFQALQQANIARTLLRSRMDHKKRVIATIRLAIAQLEQDLALEAGTRASLHSLNLRLVDALREMDGLVGELDEVVTEAHGIPRTRLGRLIEKLKALMRHWRAFQRNKRLAMAGSDAVAQDGVHGG